MRLYMSVFSTDKNHESATLNIYIIIMGKKADIKTETYSMCISSALETLSNSS